MVLRGANTKTKVKRDFEAICRHFGNLLEDGPMMWADIRYRSRSAGGQFGLGLLGQAMVEMIKAEEVREIEKDEQILRGLRKADQPGAVARWFELCRR
jgi:hypothetical protein